jgi:pyridoxine kinase
MATVLAISSHVARGSVGLAATVPALQWLCHEAWAIPTVLLASRPGLGRQARHDLPPDDLEALLAGLEADGCWPRLDAVLTGYFPSPEAVRVTAAALQRIRQAAPAIPVLVDPIAGDGGRLYIAEATAVAIRDELLPLATIATPNLFELGWLTGSPVATLSDAVAAARRLGPPAVVATSAAETAERISTLLVVGKHHIERHSPRHQAIPNGAGDLMAGLLLGHVLNGSTPEAALDAALSELDRVLAASVGHDVLQLAALRRAGA